MHGGEPASAGKVLVQIGGRPVHLREESLIVAEFRQSPLVDAAENPAGIVPSLVPQVGIQRAEEFDGWVVPGPSQVERQLVQRLQPNRQARDHMKGVNSGHHPDPQVPLQLKPPLVSIRLRQSDLGVPDYIGKSGMKYHTTFSRRQPEADSLIDIAAHLNPADIADVTGATYTYLVNGKPPAAVPGCLQRMCCKCYISNRFRHAP